MGSWGESSPAESYKVLYRRLFEFLSGDESAFVSILPRSFLLVKKTRLSLRLNPMEETKGYSAHPFAFDVNDKIVQSRRGHQYTSDVKIAVTTWYLTVKTSRIPQA